MNKENTVIILFYVFLAISFISVISYFDILLIHKEILDILPRPITNLQYEKIINVDQKKIFDVMADVQNYPLILPKNIIDIVIIEQNDNFLIATETFIEQGVEVTLLVKHTFKPNEFHSIQILDGNAKGTIINTEFVPVGDKTKLILNIDLEFDGLLKPFTFIPKRSLNHALDTIISSFEQYAQGFNSKHEKIVDDLLREILLRPADSDGLNNYASLLKKDLITQTQLKNVLQNSLEKKLLTKSYDELISQINIVTKNTINDVYIEMLKRPVDPHGLSYYGTLLENQEITLNEIKTQLFESKEGFNVRIDSDAKRTIEDLFQEISSRHATFDELEFYSQLLISKEMTKNEIRNELLNIKSDKINVIQDD